MVGWGGCFGDQDWRKGRRRSRAGQREKLGWDTVLMKPHLLHDTVGLRWHFTLFQVGARESNFHIPMLRNRKRDVILDVPVLFIKDSPQRGLTFWGLPSSNSPSIWGDKSFSPSGGLLTLHSIHRDTPCPPSEVNILSCCSFLLPQIVPPLDF